MIWEIFNLPATIFLFLFNVSAWGGLVYGTYVGITHVIKKYDIF